VPTLDALAARLPFAEAAVCPILDARKGEVYLSLYRWDGQEMVRIGTTAADTRAAAARLEAPVILLGDGIAACRPGSRGWRRLSGGRLPAHAGPRRGLSDRRVCSRG